MLYSKEKGQEPKAKKNLRPEIRLGNKLITDISAKENTHSVEH